MEAVVVSGNRDIREEGTLMRHKIRELGAGILHYGLILSGISTQSKKICLIF